jgi:hypothetical protein
LAADRTRSGPSGPASSVPRGRIAARQAPPRPSAQGAGRRSASLPASPRREATTGSGSGRSPRHA